MKEREQQRRERSPAGSSFGTADGDVRQSQQYHEHALSTKQQGRESETRQKLKRSSTQEFNAEGEVIVNDNRQCLVWDEQDAVVAENEKNHSQSARINEELASRLNGITDHLSYNLKDILDTRRQMSDIVKDIQRAIIDLGQQIQDNKDKKSTVQSQSFTFDIAADDEPKGHDNNNRQTIQFATHKERWSDVDVEDENNDDDEAAWLKIVGPEPPWDDNNEEIQTVWYEWHDRYMNGDGCSFATSAGKPEGLDADAVLFTPQHVLSQITAIPGLGYGAPMLET